MASHHGYIFFGVLATLILGAAFFTNRNESKESVDDLVAAGRNAGIGILSASVLASWVWTLTLMGSSEAGMWFGVTGGIHYAWGAVVPFVVFVPVALRLRNLMPQAATFSEFIKLRFDKPTHITFLLFGIGVSLYVFTQQLIGVGVLFETTFNMSYQLGVILTGLLVALYVSTCGLRGSLRTDLLQFLVIAFGCLTLLPWLIIEVGGIEFIYGGLLDVVQNPKNRNHNPDVLSFVSIPGLRYGVAAVAICMGQVLFEQGYYQRAVAASDSQNLKKAYIIGGIFAWFAIPVAFGAVVGSVGLALNLGGGVGIESTSEVAPYVFATVLGPVGAIIFTTMTFMAATSTADTSLTGIQSLLTADFYDEYVRGKTENEEKRQIRFGRFCSILVASVGVVIALCLEGFSLLSIDIFSGILFACPVAAFMFGIFGKRLTSTVALLSIAVGFGGGLSAWWLIEDSEINWFIGNVISLLAPALFILCSYPFLSYEFSFEKLRDWSPNHIAMKGKEND